MSTTSTFLNYPPNLPDAKLDELKGHAVDWAIAHGLVVRPPATTTNADAPLVTHAPIALFPSPFPRNSYELAIQYQPLFNKLVDAVARDENFLKEVMDSLSQVDDFVGKLYDIYKEVKQEDVVQRIRLGLHRSDYLLHQSPDGDQLKMQQVELNTIASSFSSLSGLVSDLHKYLLARTDFFNKHAPGSRDITSEDLPNNLSLSSIAKGIAKAWVLYGNPKAVAVMVVQPGERNAFDQRWIEYKLFDQYGVPLLRKSLAEILEQGRLEGPQRKLFIGENEVAVTYFRAGYAPTDYPTDLEWQGRLLIERSFSIKCPDAAYHLAGTKKIQQILAMPGMLERFLPSKSESDLLRQCFTGLYPLDDSEAGHQAAQMAMTKPDGFVMKPQREGGGNNIYSSDIPKHLAKMSVNERNGYILMDLIRSPPLQNIMVRNGQLIKGDVVSELGVYGLWVSEGDVVHMNECGGHLLRTKAATSNEGGVAAGFAVLDSPFLI
ncbi:glutathione synthase [Gaertneriomyces semiglobifer]|nr:glutathione synthase [Gaertneriomyces semiglobifer]